MFRFIIASCLLLACSLSAAAGTLTIANTTAITAYQSEVPVAYFPGANPYVAQAPIGSEFTTTSLTVTAVPGAGGVAVDFQYLTRFSGAEIMDGVLVANADIFLGNSQGFTNAIALGGQTANAGLQAGFYSISGFATSQQIWSGRPQFIFGGAYGADAAIEPGQSGYSAAAAPTVLTAGRRLGGATITETDVGSGWFQLDAQITLTPAQAAFYAGGMDVFWGTGDCANGAFLATLSGLPMPEPCSAALLASGMFYLLFRRRIGSDGVAGSRTSAS